MMDGVVRPLASYRKFVAAQMNPGKARRLIWSSADTFCQSVLIQRQVNFAVTCSSLTARASASRPLSD
jgi:hypothetical protein